MELGICAFPLSRGKNTGRGLERVVEEFCSYLSFNSKKYFFYEKGIITNEFKAVLKSLEYLKELKKADNDCYFSIYPVAGIFPIALNKKKVITLVHDLIPYYISGFDNKIKYAIKRWCIKYTCKKSNILIVPFSSTKNQLIELFNITEKKIFIVPYGLDRSNYYLDRSIQKNQYQLSFLGEAKRAKGIDTVIKSFSQVIKKYPQAKLKIASNGRELDKMKKLSAELLPINSYEFLGFVPEEKMRQFYSETDVFLFPSRYGFGLSSLEAMACGTPAIVGENLDAKDFISDKDLLVNPEDYLELADKILALFQNRELYNQKISNALEIAKQYSWDIMSENYYDLCLKMSNGEI